MSLAKQLYELQEIDLAIESAERSRQQKTGQLGESEALRSARDRHNAAQKHLEELKQKQRASDHDVDELTKKIKKADGELYSGRIRPAFAPLAKHRRKGGDR